jgi:SAM domain (Sterile alpha motif)
MEEIADWLEKLGMSEYTQSFTEHRIDVSVLRDLTDTTRMDSEDLREVISAYQKCVTEAVCRFDGFVARYMGDGVLVYFGYPRAHEDDAERAIRAGLELIKAVSELKSRLPCRPVSELRPGWSSSAISSVGGRRRSAASLARRRISRRGCRRLPSRTWSSSVTAPADFSAISLNWRTLGLGTSRASPGRRGPGRRCARVPW